MAINQADFAMMNFDLIFLVPLSHDLQYGRSLFIFQMANESIVLYRAPKERIFRIEEHLTLAKQHVFVVP